jgi:hypothetical protein
MPAEKRGKMARQNTEGNERKDMKTEKQVTHHCYPRGSGDFCTDVATPPLATFLLSRTVKTRRVENMIGNLRRRGVRLHWEAHKHASMASRQWVYAVS